MQNNIIKQNEIKQINKQTNNINKLYQKCMLGIKMNILEDILYKPNVYSFNDLFKSLEDDLNEVKKKYGENIKNKKAHDAFMYNYDIYIGLRYKIINNYNGQHVTNAWLKCYEIISYFGLIKPTKTIYRTFSNAELPGAFISAINHYVNTMCPNVVLDWYASSLVIGESIENKKNILEDYYGIYEYNPNRWLMSVDNIDIKKMLDINKILDTNKMLDTKLSNVISNNNLKTLVKLDKYINDGNVMILKNLYDFKEKLGDPVDLYTHDLGIDVSDNYRDQEKTNIRAHLGASLSGFLVLARGGNFIAKQYTYFQPLSINLIIIYASMFEEFYVCKPMTSKPTNSEIYLVGKGFIGMSEKIKKILIDKLENFNFDQIIDEKIMRESLKEPLYNMVEFANIIYKQQMKFLNEYIELYNKYYNKQSLFVRKISKIKNKRISNWIKKNPIKTINVSSYISSRKKN